MPFQNLTSPSQAFKTLQQAFRNPVKAFESLYSTLEGLYNPFQGPKKLHGRFKPCKSLWTIFEHLTLVHLCSSVKEV